MRDHVTEGSVDCVFADPPFNIGQDYDPRDRKADRKPWDEYAEFTDAWIAAAVGLLRPGGAMFVHCADHFADLVSLRLKMAGLVRINWIIWHYRFGQYGETAFINSKAHLHYFIKPEGRGAKEKRTWNVQEMLEPSQRLLDGDKRVQQAKYGGHRPFFDVWYGDGLCRVQGNNDERTKHPNQLPELYLARVIRCATNPGDLIFDSFLGSGTTSTVAIALGRNCYGCELVPEVAETAWKRTLAGPKRDVKGSLVSASSLPRDDEIRDV